MWSVSGCDSEPSLSNWTSRKSPELLIGSELMERTFKLLMTASSQEWRMIYGPKIVKLCNNQCMDKSKGKNARVRISGRL